MESLLIEALGYAKMGLPVFPLAKLSKVPLKNTSGFKQATTDEELIFEWFIQSEPLNIGISLVDTPYFVVDCDRHTDEQDGLKSLMELSKGEPLLDGAVTVKTPNDGIHFYFKQPKSIEIKNQIGFKTGLDIIKNFVVGPGSRVKRQDGTVGTYEVINGSLDSIGEAPAFILNAITSNQQPKESSEVYTLDYSSSGNTKKYTATLLEEIVQGVDESERNVWVTRVTGKLLRLGMNSKEAYEFLLIVNENFVRPSLHDKEINTIFKSILKAESNKRKGVAT